jgi:glycine/D-amino acid oxidase-like deaminating enzyme
MPHVVAPLRGGFVYVFVKELDNGLRVVVGQEDLVRDDDHDQPVDYFAALLDAGAADRFPFLRAAGVEQVLWGLDWARKTPHIGRHGDGLFTVNCGSAVRVCLPAGRLAADAAGDAVAEAV